MLRVSRILALSLAVLLGASEARASGTLKPKGSPELPIQIQEHHVAVSILDGFARTEVSQTFSNPNAKDLEAIYSFPIPKSASLAEMTIQAGETRLEGEVVKKDEAQKAYEEERDSGSDAGLARQDTYKTFEFLVARVPANGEASFRFVYYQPLELDTGVGRYVYPLEDGGTDELARAFWEKEETVHRAFSFHLELSSSWPVADARMPGIEAAASLRKVDAGHWTADVDSEGGAKLDRDIVFYYRLEDDLPGRVELIPYRASADGPGTFMLVLTPGVDLAPLSNGADYEFVLDVSGSMEGKLQTLVDGVVRVLGSLQPKDRFRVVAFASTAWEVVPWTTATPPDVARALKKVKSMQIRGGTNLYEGIKLGLTKLDADRATSLVLVTDAVANEGEVDPRKFHDLLKASDIRVFGFLLGNSANWPLMRTIADASGGFYAPVSNADDIVGQLLLAKQKITHEAMHDAKLTLGGVRTHDVSAMRAKVYHGQQLVLFGRYSEPGTLDIRLDARITGQDQVYQTTAELPAIATEHPELERLWALDKIEAIQLQTDLGQVSANESRDAIADLGVAYQIVTDHTSMLVLRDDAFERRGIDRKNRDRTAREHEAQAQRAAAPVVSHRVDTQAPAFPQRAHSVGHGGGAIDPLTLVAALGAAAATAGSAIRSRRGSKS